MKCTFQRTKLHLNSILELKSAVGLYDAPSWLSPVERLAVNQSVKGPNPFDGANSNEKMDCPVSLIFPFKSSTMIALTRFSGTFSVWKKSTVLLLTISCPVTRPGSLIHKLQAHNDNAFNIALTWKVAFRPLQSRSPQTPSNPKQKSDPTRKNLRRKVATFTYEGS